jgi:pimeloyl-ACP methyl ester carboxylesterase
LREDCRSDYHEMDLDIVSYPGSPEKPAIVFIHGLGMDKNIWVAPSKSRILGGIFPLKVLVGRYVSGKPRVLHTLFHDLKKRHYPVITWSQKRTTGPILSVIPELTAIIRIARGMTAEGIILVGHSRGGLIGRKYLSKTDSPIKGLITLATPHKGSAIAKVARYFSPLASLINPLVANSDKNSVARSIKRIGEFLKSRALQELLPESHFFESLNDDPRAGVSYVSAGGINPALFNFSTFSFPVIFEKIIPEHLYPVEMKKGKGDGLVSAESSKIPWSGEQYYFDCNHAEILFDKKARDTFIHAIELMCL